MSTFNHYSKDKSKYDQMWEAYQSDPTTERQRELLIALKPTINSAITSFGGGNKALLTRAYIITKNALEKYDPKKGTNLKTYVYSNLQKLSRHNNNRNTIVKIPEGARLDNTRVYKFRREFEDKYDREPTIQEVSDGTGLSSMRVTKLGALKPETSMSRLVSDETGDSLAGKEENKLDTWSDYIYHDLDRDGKKIFEWTTGYGGAKTLSKKDIASKLGISAPAVSQRINTIIGKMEKGLGL
jgi:DNA-directed RNA polymerase specialized sigma subunit